MKFFITQEDYNKIIKGKGSDPYLEIIFIRRGYSYTHPYQIHMQIMKIETEPFEQRVKNAWNNLLKKMRWL